MGHANCKRRLILCDFLELPVENLKTNKKHVQIYLNLKRKQSSEKGYLCINGTKYPEENL